MKKKEMFKEFPELISENFIFREIQEPDSQDLHDIWSNNEVMKYTIEPKRTIDKMQAYLARFKTDFEKYDIIWFAVYSKKDKQVVAVLKVFNVKVRADFLEFMLCHNNSKCSEELIIKIIESATKCFIDKFDINRVVFKVPPINHFLVKVLEKSFFKRECLTQKSLYLTKFGLVDELIYGFLRSDLTASNNYRSATIDKTILQEEQAKIKGGRPDMKLGLLLKGLSILEDDTVSIKPCCMEDALTLHEMLSQFDIFRYTNGSPSKNFNVTKEKINTCLKRLFVWSVFLREQPDRAIGMISLHSFDPIIKEVEIGYMINKNYWQKQAATRSTKLIIKWLLDNADISRIVARVVPANIASCKVVEKCGFVFEGTLRQSDYWQQIEDLSVYAIVKNNQ